MTRHGFPILAGTALVCIVAAPAAAQRYTAKQDGDVVALADTTAKMNVEVVTSLGKAWKIQVKGQNLVRTSPSLEAFDGEFRSQRDAAARAICEPSG